MLRPSILLLFCLGTILVHAQQASNRLFAHSRITPERLTKIEQKGYHICKTKVDSIRYTVDGFKKPFKCVATLGKGVISVDPWSIVDSTTNAGVPDSVSRGITRRAITVTTPADLEIDLNRKSLGQTTKVVKIPFRAMTITLNSLPIKIRPSAEDSAGYKYDPVVTSSFNLGLSCGYTFGSTAFTHRAANTWSGTFSGGLGIGAAALKNETFQTTIDPKYSPSNLLLSPNMSFTYARNDIGLVLAAGWDYMVGSHADWWLYQGKLFVGFGLSVGLKV